jgi:hypothetical protein
MGAGFSSSSGKLKWKKVNDVYDILDRRLRIQKKIDRLNIQFDELTNEINIQKVDLRDNVENIDNLGEPIIEDTLLRNSLLYSQGSFVKKTF